MKFLSASLFVFSMLLAVLMILEVNIPYFNRIYLIYGIFLCGGLGILLNLINVKNSKHAILYSVFYWLACLCMLLGIMMIFLALPYALYVIFLGAALILISFFLPKAPQQKEAKNSDLLDDYKGNNE